MFCFQCQETISGKGCFAKVGFCGKNEEVANLQDLLIFVIKGVAYLNTIAKENGINTREYDEVIVSALFSTITNVNFDPTFFIETINKAIKKRNALYKQIQDKAIVLSNLPDCVIWTPESDDSFNEKAMQIGVLSTENEDIRSLKELVIYGLKGMAAYTEHSTNLKYNNDELNTFFSKALAETLREDISVDELVALVMETGKFGVDAMALLDKANTESYGNPEITKVKLGVRNNPAILITGHDLKDIEMLLEQTRGTGVDVYTHSEMLPAHYYPKLKEYDNLVGNYGSSWWHQTEDFETFNGPVLFTTNCLVPPKKSATYSDRIYTTGVVGYPGFKNIQADANGNKDFSEIIEHAKKCSAPSEIETGEIIGGFAHNQVLSLADKVVEAVKSGAIKKFVVMAGCDGRMKSREYYTEFANELPNDTVILTAGCAKYRYNKLLLGDIGGIPRVLDAGQCNDSYSLALIALKLKEVFGLEDINDLPIFYNIAWYEQKAVIVLLALLYLGVKNIHLGPTLPAFLSPNIAKFLVENFGIAAIDTVDSDIQKYILN